MDHIEKRILDIIESKKDEIMEFGRDIFNNAEMGYKEFRTAGKFTDVMNSLGLETETGLAITGVKSYLKGKNSDGLVVGLMGEMDALPITNARHSNPETGAAHCCGHNAQLAGVMGAALALTDPEVVAALDGNVVFFGVPAEEFVEIEFKTELMKEGKIRYGGGKSELIRIGACDDLDVCVGHHNNVDHVIAIKNNPTNGFINKSVKFIGKSSHAAGAPHLGIDALNAATIATTAVNFQRESFQDKDNVRVHGFISRGGEAVNVIADNVTMEWCTRANNVAAIKDASYKCDRGLKAGALATGCGLEIISLPGYLPTLPVEHTEALEEAIATAIPGVEPKVFGPDFQQTGSTDFGDVSSIMPLLQFTTGGWTGVNHNPNLDVVDEYTAYVLTAKVFALTTYNLLKNGAAYAKTLLDSYTPVFTRESFTAYMESMLSENISMDIVPVPSFE